LFILQYFTLNISCFAGAKIEKNSEKIAFCAILIVFLAQLFGRAASACFAGKLKIKN
jgi:hypothetical protein